MDLHFDVEGFDFFQYDDARRFAQAKAQQMQRTFYVYAMRDDRIILSEPVDPPMAAEIIQF